MKVTKGHRDALADYAQPEYRIDRKVSIDALVLLDLLADVDDLCDALLALAADVRQPCSAELSPEKTDERIVVQLERLAEEINA